MMDAVDKLRSRLDEIAPAWAGYSTAFGALVVLLILRRFIAPASRWRTRTPTLFLLLTMALRLAASMSIATGYWQAWGVLNLLSVLCLVVGLTGLAGVVVFDVALRRRPAPAVVRDLLQIMLVTAIFLGILSQHGFDPVSLAATGGVLTAVIGFALQSTIANVFAGVALPLERQLAIGDWIQVAGHTGHIREIRWRSTTIVTKDNDTVIVPNNQLLTTDVANYSRPTPAHRVWHHVGFHYRHPPNEVREMLLGAIHGLPGVLTDPAPDCFPVEFAESSVVYALRYWIDDFAHSEPIDGEVRTRVWYAARRAGFEIPYPIRTIQQAPPAPSAEADEGTRLAALGRVDIFAPLDDACRHRLAVAMREQRFGAGEDIIRQDTPGDSLFIISRGEVGIHVGVDGSSRAIARLGPGQFFGEMSLMTGEPRQATVTAVTDTICYVIDQNAFRCVTSPAIVEEIAKILAERQTELEMNREGLGAEARARRMRDARSQLLRSIRDAFGL